MILGHRLSVNDLRLRYHYQCFLFELSIMMFPSTFSGGCFGFTSNLRFLKGILNFLNSFRFGLDATLCEDWLAWLMQEGYRLFLGLCGDLLLSTAEDCWLGDKSIDPAID